MNKQVKAESIERLRCGKNAKAYTKWRHIKYGTGGVHGPLEEDKTDQTPVERKGGVKSRKNLGALLWPLALHVFYISN